MTPQSSVMSLIVILFRGLRLSLIHIFLFFFFIYRFDGFGDAVSTMTGILMPFIYGAVIAYLLKPVCNTSA